MRKIPRHKGGPEARGGFAICEIPLDKFAMRRVFPTADAVERFTVFNIKGNAYRLITEINYQTGRIFLRQVLTHAEYSKGGWEG